MWRRLIDLLIVGTSFLLPLPMAGAALKAGAARVDITPPTGLAMYGYGNRKGTSTGVLDPLLARVLVLEAGEKSLALVVLDLGRVFAPPWIERLRANAQKSCGISYVLWRLLTLTPAQRSRMFTHLAKGQTGRAVRWKK